MKAVVIAKYVTAGAGILVFGAGMRTENESLRWTGIGIVAVAWFLRFVTEDRSTDAGDEPEPPSQA